MMFTHAELVDRVQSEMHLETLGRDIVLRILDAHQPEVPPAGQEWLSGGAKPHCSGCSTGDPYLDADWPCQTVESIVDVLDGKPVEPAFHGDLAPMIDFNTPEGI